jgi:hypothetical protein
MKMYTTTVLDDQGFMLQAYEMFTTTLSLAIPKAISREGSEVSQIDYYDINEAFSVSLISRHALFATWMSFEPR